MPIYEYACRKCGGKFERFVRSASDTEEIECPECGAKEVDKLFSAFCSGPSGDGGASSGSSCASPGPFR